MMVAVLVICYVLILRYLDQKNRERDRLKAGLAESGPADYATIKKALRELSQRLTSLENEYHELCARGAPALNS